MYSQKQKDYARAIKYGEQVLQVKKSNLLSPHEDFEDSRELQIITREGALKARKLA